MRSKLNESPDSVLVLVLDNPQKYQFILTVMRNFHSFNKENSLSTSRKLVVIACNNTTDYSFKQTAVFFSTPLSRISSVDNFRLISPKSAVSVLNTNLKSFLKKTVTDEKGNSVGKFEHASWNHVVFGTVEKTLAEYTSQNFKQGPLIEHYLNFSRKKDNLKSLADSMRKVILAYISRCDKKRQTVLNGKKFWKMFRNVMATEKLTIQGNYEEIIFRALTNDSDFGPLFKFVFA